MAYEVIMPKVDMVMETGTFVEWLKEEGDSVVKGEPIFTIMTDKAAMEIEAPESGILSGLRARPDDVVPVSETIAFILEPGETLPDETPSAMSFPPNETLQPQLDPGGPIRSPVSEMDPITREVKDPGNKVRATPVARQLAKEFGLDLAAISGRGPRGRIHKADVLAAVEAANRFQARPAPVQSPTLDRFDSTKPLQGTLPDANYKEPIPLAGPRAIIAERMAYSASVAPHIYLSVSVNMSEATRLRNRVKTQIEEETGYPPSFTAIIACAVAKTLPRHPFLNASLSGDLIYLWDDVHLGIATSLDDYLIVPVIRSAQTKNLKELVVSLSELIKRSQAKRLIPSEMSGSTFTISNLGMYGIESFTAIINPPEAAILAVGKIDERLIKTEEGEVFQPVMEMNLGADHRIVDGVKAARFLVDLKAILENPYLLI